MPEYILQLKNVVKTFPGVTALDGVDFAVRPGEIHALIGENGAGKSTLIKIITGVHQPDEGDIILDGEIITLEGPRDGQQHGIATIYQDPTVFPDLNVVENVFMGHHRQRGVSHQIQWDEMYAETEELLESLDLDIDPATRMEELNAAERQLVEIAKALSFDSRILIMDEPTSSLTPEEIDQLFEVIRQVREAGSTVIFISHKLEEVSEISDRLTVLRDGNYIGTSETVEVTRDEVIHMMVGRDLSEMFAEEEQPTQSTSGSTKLSVEGLTKQGEFSNIDLELRGGEIVGLAGLVGAGRTEVAEAIFGLKGIDGGEVAVEGRRVNITEPAEALDEGIAYLPEDRQQNGLVSEMTITENVSLPVLDRISERGLLNKKKEEDLTEEYIDLLDIKTAGFWQTAKQLSGGNQQKVVLAKWLATNPQVLILDEPTKGIDVNTKASVHRLMRDLTAEGLAILMISSELPEVLAMSDRVLVMHEGEISAKLEAEEASQEKIISAATGQPVS